MSRRLKAIEQQHQQKNYSKITIHSRNHRINEIATYQLTFVEWYHQWQLVLDLRREARGDWNIHWCAALHWSRKCTSQSMCFTSHAKQQNKVLFTSVLLHIVAQTK